jgi:hypothetical protein
MPSKRSPSFMFSYQNFVCISLLSHASYMPYPSYPFIILIIAYKEYKMSAIKEHQNQ